MLVYDFKFGPDYAGQSATVSEVGGVEVDESPVTLDADGTASLELAEGSYRAQASNSSLGLGNVVTSGVVNFGASIAAGGGEIGEPLLFEINNGATLPINGGALTWDTAPEGYEPGSALQIPAGIYSVWVEIDFDQPAEDRLVTVRRNGPFFISSEAANYRGYTAQATFPAVVANGSFVVSLAGATKDGSVSSPDDWSIGYASVEFTKIG